MRIALVACCSKKLGVPAPAQMLYISPLFKKAMAYAKTFDHWYILSAKYGLVEPDEVIAPYDVTLNQMRLLARHYWGWKILEQMEEREIVRQEITAFAGVRYVEPLIHLGLEVKQPLLGLSIGRQLQWFKWKGY